MTFTDERLLTRRDQPKYLQLMETIAFLRQMQKPVKQATEDGQAYDYIEVSLSDIALANELALEILGALAGRTQRPEPETASVNRRTGQQTRQGTET